MSLSYCLVPGPALSSQEQLSECGGERRVVQRARLGAPHVPGIQPPQPRWTLALCWVRGEEGPAESRGAAAPPSRSHQPLFYGCSSCWMWSETLAHSLTCGQAAGEPPASPDLSFPICRMGVLDWIVPRLMLALPPLGRPGGGSLLSCPRWVLQGRGRAPVREKSPFHLASWCSNRGSRLSFPASRPRGLLFSLELS